MNRLLLTIVISIIMLPVSGCQSPPAVEETEILPAPIHEVKVNIAESDPPQVFIYIKGGLRDGCTSFHELETERRENDINITVTTERPKDANCTQVYSYFEKNAGLGTDFISGETYVVNVNDQTTSFVMQ